MRYNCYHLTNKYLLAIIKARGKLWKLNVKCVAKSLRLKGEMLNTVLIASKSSIKSGNGRQKQRDASQTNALIVGSLALAEERDARIVGLRENSITHGMVVCTKLLMGMFTSMLLSILELVNTTMSMSRSIALYGRKHIISYSLMVISSITLMALRMITVLKTLWLSNLKTIQQVLYVNSYNLVSRN